PTGATLPAFPEFGVPPAAWPFRSAAEVFMNISSRTPEGEPYRCSVCFNSLSIEPSHPPGDAPCPFCGTLLWFPKSSRPIKAKDRVRVTVGTFAAMEGEVLGYNESQGLLRIELSVFGRP